MRPPYEPVPSPEPDAERTQALPPVVQGYGPRPPATVGEVAAARDARTARRPVALPIEAAPARPRLSEAQVLRYGLTVLALIASLGLIVTVGVSLPRLPWLPWLIGTVVYGVLGVRVWIAQQQAERERENAARVREENARRGRFMMPPGVVRSGEPVNDDGSWAT